MKQSSELLPLQIQEESGEHGDCDYRWLQKSGYSGNQEQVESKNVDNDRSQDQQAKVASLWNRHQNAADDLEDLDECEVSGWSDSSEE